MGSKRKANETEEERKERKSLKKEAKKKESEKAEATEKKTIGKSKTPRAPKEEDEGEKEATTSETFTSNQPSTSTTSKHVSVSPLLHKRKLYMTISLLPGNLGFVTANIEDAMKGFLLKYSAGLGGIMLAFEDLQIRNDGKGRILGELPHIHYDIECMALIFKPVVGAELDGMIIETFDSHVSMIVHQYFNASIAAHHLRNAGFQYDSSGRKWVSFEKDDQKKIGRRAFLRFTIERVHDSGTYSAR